MTDGTEPAELCTQAKELFAHGEYAKAGELFAQAVGADPANVDAHHGLGTVHFLKGELDAALACFNHVMRLDPLRQSAYINAGAICNRLDRLGEARDYLLAGLQKGSPMAQAFYNLGIVYRRQGELARAIDAYREATHLDPNLVDAHHNLGNCLFELKQFQDAAAAYQRALEVDPSFERARNGLARSAAAMDTAPGSGPQPAGPGAPARPAAAPAETDEQAETLTRKQLPHVRAEFSERLTNCGRFLTDHVNHIERDLDPATRDLSRTLLHASQLTYEDLAAVYGKFQSALEADQVALKSLVATVGALRKSSERMLQCLAAAPDE